MANHEGGKRMSKVWETMMKLIPFLSPPAVNPKVQWLLTVEVWENTAKGLEEI